MTNYVCGFNAEGKFLSACVYDETDENTIKRSLGRPKALNRSVVLTEIVEQNIFDLYKQGYYRSADGVPTSPELQFSIGQIFEGKAPVDAYTWSENHNALIEEIESGEGCVRRFQIIAIPEPSAEELQAQALADAKRERATEVERLTVEVEGMVFDADETSQARMSVAASSMTDDETNVWVLHDNSVVQVTKAQLLQACRLARIAQSAVWTKPYENASV